MNTFGKLEALKNFTFEKVKYYSIRFEHSENNEFHDFLNRMEDESEYEEDMNNLFVWLEYIGQKEGAKEKYFRHEGYNSDASALPPPSSIMEVHEIPVNDIRLYCFRLNEHVVALFNGGIKTTDKAQDCPNVSQYFKQANNIVKKLNQLFIENELSWNDDFTDIIFDDDLTIEI
ncbi:unnamed protein product [marine sediment metagenome]|uniref:Uncharacterized protein n=1 Tax=marine sediment metagenome TaxID=412755 RepID=X1IPW1_9ZZZZ